MCLEYNGMEGDWQLVKWVGLCVVCVVRACVQDGLRWDMQGYIPHLLHVTEDEWRKFPPEQILHPPLAAALS